MNPDEASERLRQGERAGGQALAELRWRRDCASALAALLIGTLGLALAIDARTPPPRSRR